MRTRPLATILSTSIALLTICFARGSSAQGFPVEWENSGQPEPSGGALAVDAQGDAVAAQSPRNLNDLNCCVNLDLNPLCSVETTAACLASPGVPIHGAVCCLLPVLADACTGNSCDTGRCGVCQLGTNVCDGGQLLCAQVTGGAAETCDGLDNDCNCAVDDGLFCGWATGDVITYSQGSWGGDPTPTNAAGILQSNYDDVYAATAGVLEVGIPGSAGYSMSFTDEDYVLGFLPAVGSSGPLSGDVVNPSVSPSGTFGGEVLALRINIDFSDAGITLGNRGVPFGDLTLCDIPGLPLLHGVTVRQFSSEVNNLLGGGSGNHTIAQLFPIAAELNGSFSAGAVSSFAEDHIVIGACP
jgi:hypothetical protein